MSHIQISRKGTHPIFKYSLLGEFGWRAAVFIDDEYGNIQVEFDNRNFFGHWWNAKQNGGSLRGFLVSTNVGYINDKFSYGLERWCGEQAKKALAIFLEKNFGPPYDWPEEIKDLFEDGIDEDMSKDMFYNTLWNCDLFTSDMYLEEESFGSIGANKKVLEFTEMFWKALIEHWKEELKNEEINKSSEGSPGGDS